MSQAEGALGWFVDRMIRRTVRKRFHSVQWIPPATPITAPCILVPNHHGWHDGYVMYHAVTALRLRSLDWIQEFDVFPLFGKVGGMPFPSSDPHRRARTIRRTIRLMTQQKRNLILFAESQLHPPPEILPFGKALDLIASKVAGASVVPVAIRYEISMHERPECFLMFGAPMEQGDRLSERTRLTTKRLLDELAMKIRFEQSSFELLVRGTQDVNERMDMRRITGRRTDGR